jgi:hypothetical protein
MGARPSKSRASSKGNADGTDHMNLKTISGFRNTEEAKVISAAIEFRAKGFDHAPEALEQRPHAVPIVAAH